MSISFRKDCDKEKENNLSTLIIEMYIILARAIIMSTLYASTVFLSSFIL